jgi:Na+-transporting NADH:ubiquinone oxidoreductase subunit C
MSTARTKQNFFTVFFMFAVTFVFISLVTLVQMVTADTVEQNKTVFLKQAVREAGGLPSTATLESLMTWYEANVDVVNTEDNQPDYFRLKSEDETGITVVATTGPGLWGMITALVGITSDGTKIIGVTFTDHIETPGLGARIDEPWFKRQFVGRQGPFKKLRAEPKDKSGSHPTPGSFDQITGATITSTAVRDIMNRSLERARELGNTQ